MFNNLKRIVKKIYFYCFSSIYRRLNRSSLFDRYFYLYDNPDVLEQDADPLIHYIQTGWKEGRSPSFLFDSLSSRQNSSEVDDFTEIPLYHYLRDGAEVKKLPCSWFNDEFYNSAYQQHGSRRKILPAEHFSQKGVQAKHYPNPKVQLLDVKPLISLVVPVYNIDIKYLNRCLYSVLYQSYPHWQLCIADDCSSDPNIKEHLEKWRLKDHRINIVYLKNNLGIAGATNTAAGMATGDYIGFLDNDDELAPECLYEFVKTINETDADLIYSDESLIDTRSKEINIFHKPAFNQHLLLSHNYITHFVVTKMNLFRSVGELSSGTDGAQDFDLVLKLSEVATDIVHIPKVLYRWRALDSSTSINHSQKEYANEAGRRALSAYMKRNYLQGDVEMTDLKFFYRIRRERIASPPITIIIYIKSIDQHLVGQVENLIQKTVYPQLEWIVIAPYSNMVFKKMKDQDSTITLLDKTEEISRSKLLNQAGANCSGHYLVFIDQKSLRLDDGWLESLLEYGLDERAGCVGGRIKFKNNRDQPLLVHPDIDNDCPVYFKNFVQGCSIHMNGLHCSQEVLIVTPALFMISKYVFLLNDGFDEQKYPHLFYVHDLCLRLHVQKYRNIYTPYCKATIQLPVYPQSVAPNRKHEQLRFQERWKKQLQAGDPYWSRELLKQRNVPLANFLTWYTGD